MSIEIFTQGPGTTLKNFWNCIHFHPTDAIEDGWGQKILNRVSTDGAAHTVRMYAMLEDIVTMDANGNLCYDFTLNDLRLDYMIEKGFRILLSYNFIPPCIAEKPALTSSVSKNKTRYKGKMIITSKPKDYGLWEEICYQYTKHILERYGEERVASWYLQCFNEPDLKAFFLNDLDQSPESVAVRLREYCKLYAGFESGIRRASKKLCIGGPALAHEDAFLEGFLTYVKEQGLQMDYVCIHCYGTGPKALNDGTKPIATANNLDKIRQRKGIVDRICPGIEFLVDEWGISSAGFYNREECPSLMFRESEVMAVYFGKMVTQMIEEGMDISKLIICLSGQHEMVEDFSGFRNLFTMNHIAKPIYNAYRLMAKLGTTRLPSRCDGENMTLLATDGAALITYSSEHFDEALQTRQEAVTLHGLTKETEVTVWRIDPTHLNPYSRFLKEGFSAQLTPEQVELLREEGNLKAAETVRTTGSFTLSVPSNSFILLQW